MLPQLENLKNMEFRKITQDELKATLRYHAKKYGLQVRDLEYRIDKMGALHIRSRKDAAEKRKIKEGN